MGPSDRRDVITLHPSPRAAAEHDLRTPLTVIRAVAEILRDNHELPREDKERLLGALEEESSRLCQSIEVVLGAVCDRSLPDGPGCAWRQAAGMD